jgi:hypothetical protein
MNIIEAIADRRLLGAAFKDSATFEPWRAFLASLFGLPLSQDQAALYRACTGRSELPGGRYGEAWLCCGRRAGKSFILAVIAIYLACFKEYGRYLGPGERAMIKVIAADRKQARTIMRYTKGLLEIEMLAHLLENETAESIDLNNRVTIEVGTASFKSLRGYTLAAALCDEIAFWSTSEDAAASDEDILAALRPAMSTIPGSMLLCASSPYAKRGALWSNFKRYYGVDDPSVLVWKAPTRVMNDTVPQRVIDEARERDPDSAASEYDAEFRNDVGAFVDRAVIEAAVATGVTVRAPLSGVNYVGFVDPSGGSSDSMTMAVAHAEGDKVVLDCVAERRPPFSPDGVVSEFAETFRSYRVRTIHGDRYAGEWPRERFRASGIEYRVAEKSRSDLYLSFLPLLNSGRVALIDNQRMVAQLAGLERRTSRAGRDSVDHAPGSHDDLSNSAAGALVMVGDGAMGPIRINPNFVAQMARAAQMRAYRVL